MARRTIWRWIKRVLGIVLLVTVGLIAYFIYRAAPIVTGYSAKILCSGVFVSERPQESVLGEDLEWFSWLRLNVDPSSQTAESSLGGWFRREAAYRPGLGCTLLIGMTRQRLLEQARGFSTPAAPSPSNRLWPQGERTDPSPGPTEIASAVQQIVDAELVEQDPEAPKRTRALVVVHEGRILAEGYAAGFGPSARLGGWSMAKSVTNALVGIMVREGRLSLDLPAPVPEWPPGDPRHAITLGDLLRMSSGLYFQELYFWPSTATQMLFASRSTAALAASQPLRTEPGTKWQYSSGTSNIVSRIIRHRLEGGQAEYFSFPHRVLFQPLGMHSAVFEPDPSGTFVGSSFLYATARDWARFGQFFLQDGVWEGRRLLPPDWVAYSTAANPLAPKGRYGAHWWLNRGQPPGSPNRVWPDLPPDAYFASGFEGQYVLVIPSMQLVIVRLGLSRPPAFFDIGGFARKVADKLPVAALSSTQ